MTGLIGVPRATARCVCEIAADRTAGLLAQARLVVLDLDDTLLDLRHEESQALGMMQVELRRRGIDVDGLAAVYRAIAKDDRREQRHDGYDWAEHRYVARLRRLAEYIQDRAGQFDESPAALHQHLLSLRLSLVRPTRFSAELLRMLGDNGVPVVVFTHGTTRIQAARIAAAGFSPHVRQLVTSEDVGCSKARMDRWWGHLSSPLRSSPEDALLITDRVDPDIVGAAAFGVPSLLCQPVRKGHGDDLAVVVAGLRSTAAGAARARGRCR